MYHSSDVGMRYVISG